MKTLNEIIKIRGYKVFKLNKGGQFFCDVTPENLGEILEQYGETLVVEIGVCGVVIISLLDEEHLTVYQCRKWLNLTQKQVFEQVGVPIRTLQNWEAQVRECPEYVRKLVVAELIRLNK